MIKVWTTETSKKEFFSQIKSQTFPAQTLQKDNFLNFPRRDNHPSLVDNKNKNI